MSARNRQPKAQTDAFARTLRALVKQGENKVCADCKRNDPRWASWNIGVFLCIRCSGFHRAMGTHISRVKSIDLDVWTPEQMESIQKWGNARANKYWEHNLKPGHVPPEHKIEAFIRSKYELRRWAMKTPPPEDPSVLDDPASTSSPAPPAQSPAPVAAAAPAAAVAAAAPARRAMPPPAPAINLIDDDDTSVLSGVSTAAVSTTALPGDGLQSRITPVNTPTPSSASAQSVPAASSGGGGGLFDEDWDTPVAAPAPAASSPAAPAAPTNVKANIMSLFNTAPSFNQAPPPNPAAEPPVGTWGLADANPWSSGVPSAPSAPLTPGVWSTTSNAGTAASSGMSDLWGSTASPAATPAAQPAAAATKKDPFADIWN